MLSQPAQPQPPDLGRRLAKLTSILDVAKAMSAEHDLDLLLPLILFEATKVVEADRCSLFILDRERNELWSKVAQGSKSEIRLPVGSGIAGQVAQTGTVINIPDAYSDPRFNRSFDVSSGYQTKTILCVPMRDAHGEVTGVIQALNKLDGGFNAEDEELLLALGAQAAGAIENALLHEEINRLFEGFVSASVVAIEARDPTTAGHSGRVADLTVTMAQALEHLTTGPYANVRFSAVELQELRYASLLHDFGKVGVREPVLVKAEKLYPHELEGLRARFQLARKDLQLQSYRRRLEAVRIRGDRFLAEIEGEENERLTTELKKLDEVFDFILTCNRPTVLAQGGFERLHELGKLQYSDAHDQAQPLLLPREIQSLSITRGTLSPEERREIESHVEHTYRFLTQIPWTRTLRRVPEIAYAHHEKLDGTGYPRAEKAIPVQSRMMSISDIYDALTASDRPYKKAVPHTLALDILKREADSGQLDKELFTVFVEAEIPRRALHGNKAP
ncbi:GAF and HD-GYP domain-containing protein [Pyxidicoccus xibeiensis]|uniref:GAF and HD-GYP domain-containing protein n=1 Tax=Pyxidicoccus xibeiensis TaxID=2906759 RepID=UPI0020A72E80|nr:HD domain-containing phosphohydrolase [Pyxidicoccus xibeiensis]MCP3141613.1 GAF domain-containing protein [Pyxidicoccus xibeiensis]